MFLTSDPWSVELLAPGCGQTNEPRRMQRLGRAWTILSARGGSRLELGVDGQQRGEGAGSASDAAADLLLVRSARAGHAGDLERVLGRLRIVPRLLCALNSHLGCGLGREELEDVAQDTAARVWLKLETFNGTSSLETWFYGIARFELLNAARRVQRRAAQELEELPAPGDPLGDVDVERVRAALERIDPDEARVIHLHHFEDRTLEQAAAHLGIAASTAKGRYYRGLERLHAFLGGRRKAEPR